MTDHAASRGSSPPATATPTQSSEFDWVDQYIEEHPVEPAAPGNAGRTTDDAVMSLARPAPATDPRQKAAIAFAKTRINRAHETLERLEGGSTPEEAFGLRDLPPELRLPTTEPAEVKGTGRIPSRLLPSGPPAPPILDGWLHPTGTTILYGKGGVGKGITATWLATRLVRELGHTVLIVDFETHPHEYGSRLSGLGLTRAEADRIHYVAPHGDEWTETSGTLYEVADIIRREADEIGATFLLVDSYTPAASGDDSLGGQDAAKQMQRAFTRIGRPALLLAHVAGGGPRHPEKPFGSVHIHNLVARWTWSVEDDGAEGGDDATAPSITKLEFRHHKHNDGPIFPDKKIEFSFFVNGDIHFNAPTPKKQSAADMAHATLSRTPNLTLKELGRLIRETFDTKTDDATIRKAMVRQPRRFREDTSTKNYRWSIAP